MKLHPDSNEEIALVLREAGEKEEKVAVAGYRSWFKTEADVSIFTDQFNAITHLSDRDLTVTVGAGVKLGDLRRELARFAVWASIDPPGEDRSFGSIAATGTSGPLADVFGPLKDQLLGLTLVTGAGKIVTVGGRVMKNVAGFDLTRLVCGSFGSLGIVTEMHLRLRPSQPVDHTLIATVPMEGAPQMFSQILTSRTWSAIGMLTNFGIEERGYLGLAIRFLGRETSVKSQKRALMASTNIDWETTPSEAYWTNHSYAATAHPVSLAIGSSISRLPQLMDLISGLLPPGLTSVCRRSIRWSGTADTEQLKRFRRDAAKIGSPVTVERAPWDTLCQTGIFGNLSDGTKTIMARLRDKFDPHRVLAVGDALVVD